MRTQLIIKKGENCSNHRQTFHSRKKEEEERDMILFVFRSIASLMF